MVAINKINFINIGATNKNRTLSKMILPTISSLTVLSGSSMGSTLPPHNVGHVSGSSVTDPLEEQFGYFSDKLIDLGADAGHAVVHGVVEATGVVIDGLSDCGHDISNGATHLVDKLIDLLG